MGDGGVLLADAFLGIASQLFRRKRMLGLLETFMVHGYYIDEPLKASNSINQFPGKGHENAAAMAKSVPLRKRRSNTKMERNHCQIKRRPEEAAVVPPKGLCSYGGERDGMRKGTGKSLHRRCWRYPLSPQQYAPCGIHTSIRPGKKEAEASSVKGTMWQAAFAPTEESGAKA